MSTTPLRYLVIAEDGTTAILSRETSDGDATAILKKAVGGSFEIIATDYPDLVFWCNEDGVALRLPTNPVATAMAFLLGGPAHMLVGPVVVTGNAKDEVAGLTDDQLDSLFTIAAICRH